jgi:hypothetical protein
MTDDLTMTGLEEFNVSNSSSIFSYLTTVKSFTNLIPTDYNNNYNFSNNNNLTNREDSIEAMKAKLINKALK